MKRQVKTGFLVGILSILIWVSAERAVLRTATIRAEVRLDTTAQPNVRMQLVDEAGNPMGEQMVRVTLEVKGPQSRMRRVEEIEQGEQASPIVRITPEKLGYEPGEAGERQVYAPQVVELLGGELRFGESGAYVAVTGSEPEVVRVAVTGLVQSRLEVKVYNEVGRELPVQSLEPREVEAYVEPGTTGVAKVVLNAEQQRQASAGVIGVKAGLPAGARPAEVDVRVQLPVGGSPWPTEVVELPRVGVSKPASMEGKYEVVIEDLDAKLDVYSPIEFRGPEQARREYREAPYHLVLEVREEDLTTENPARALEYSLGGLSGEIEILNRKSEAVRFRLVQIEAPAAAEAVGPVN